MGELGAADAVVSESRGARACSQRERWAAGGGVRAMRGHTPPTSLSLDKRFFNFYQEKHDGGVCPHIAWAGFKIRSAENPTLL